MTPHPPCQSDSPGQACHHLVHRKRSNSLLGSSFLWQRGDSYLPNVGQAAGPVLLPDSDLFRTFAGRHWQAREARTDAPGETYEDNHNHALGALRYLIAALDEHKMARQHNNGPATQANPEAAKPKPRRWLSLYNEQLWRPVSW
jgi:hypothetical protein